MIITKKSKRKNTHTKRRKNTRRTADRQKKRNKHSNCKE